MGIPSRGDGPRTILVLEPASQQRTEKGTTHRDRRPLLPRTVVSSLCHHRISCQPDMGVIKICLLMAILKDRYILIFRATAHVGQQRSIPSIVVYGIKGSFITNSLILSSQEKDAPVKFPKDYRAWLIRETV